MTNKPQRETFSLDMDFEEALKRFAQVNPRRDTQEEPETTTATPFVKWAGGKRSLLSELVPRMPKEFSGYWEPFVGGGALFFAIHDRISAVHLSDITFDLVITYNAIKKDPEPLIQRLKKHAKKHGEEYYYKVRGRHNLQDPIEIAARFIYLNKSCYNGLYRINKSGQFNVPYGRYDNPNIAQESNLWACHEALQHARIEVRQFDAITPTVGDFVYFDPPYHPVSATASFTKYTAASFTEHDQARLRDFALKLHRDGVKVMVSNSDTPFIRDLYSSKTFNLATVQAPRMINSKANKRGNVSELIITNY